jgi:hypothetical protein
MATDTHCHRENGRRGFIFCKVQFFFESNRVYLQKFSNKTRKEKRKEKRKKKKALGTVLAQQ